jgi:hypothetical protein
MTPQISLAHLARPSTTGIILPFFSATASGLEPPRPAAAAVRTEGPPVYCKLDSGFPTLTVVSWLALVASA